MLSTEKKGIFTIDIFYTKPTVNTKYKSAAETWKWTKNKLRKASQKPRKPKWQT